MDLFISHGRNGHRIEMNGKEMRRMGKELYGMRRNKKEWEGLRYWF